MEIGYYRDKNADAPHRGVGPGNSGGPDTLLWRGEQTSPEHIAFLNDHTGEQLWLAWIAKGLTLTRPFAVPEGTTITSVNGSAAVREP